MEIYCHLTFDLYSTLIRIPLTPKDTAANKCNMKGLVSTFTRMHVERKKKRVVVYVMQKIFFLFFKLWRNCKEMPVFIFQSSNSFTVSDPQSKMRTKGGAAKTKEYIILKLFYFSILLASLHEYDRDILHILPLNQ